MDGSAAQAAAAAQAERLGAGGALQLEGHPMPACNGVYRRVGQELHGGFPRYEHASSGMQLYRYQASEQWRVGNKYRPHEDGCAGFIGSGGGEVPVGAQPWHIGPSSHKSGSGKWEARTVTVTELVRCSYCC